MLIHVQVWALKSAFRLASIVVLTRDFFMLGPLRSMVAKLYQVEVLLLLQANLLLRPHPQPPLYLILPAQREALWEVLATIKQLLR